ncbi:MAG: hypothetical protein KJO76_09725, partial [Gammaproteobacteria bacterium]|nr:hypothetical protein [Gammaproteobacteria bacterium]
FCGTNYSFPNFSAFQGAYIRQLTYGNDPEDFARGTRMLDQLLAIRGVGCGTDRGRRGRRLAPHPVM